MKKYVKTIMDTFHDRFFVWSKVMALLLILSVSGCRRRKELIEQPVYDGPTIIMDSVYTRLSDSAQVIMNLTAPKQKNFENEDKEWPKGMYLEYLDKEGNIESTFQADYVYYTAEDDLYKGLTNVIVKNFESGDELTTEELYWSPEEERFFTDRFVTIISEDDVLTGEGLEAKEDFSSYKILKPSGTMTIEDDEESP